MIGMVMPKGENLQARHAIAISPRLVVVHRSFSISDLRSLLIQIVIL